MRGRVFRQVEYLSWSFRLALGEGDFWVDTRILLPTQNQWSLAVRFAVKIFGAGELGSR